MAKLHAARCRVWSQCLVTRKWRQGNGLQNLPHESIERVSPRITRYIRERCCVSAEGFEDKGRDTFLDRRRVCFFCLKWYWCDINLAEMSDGKRLRPKEMPAKSRNILSWRLRYKWDLKDKTLCLNLMCSTGTRHSQWKRICTPWDCEVLLSSSLVKMSRGRHNIFVTKNYKNLYQIERHWVITDYWVTLRSH